MPQVETQQYLEVYSSAELSVFQLPVLNDNYIFILRDKLKLLTAVIDPAEAGCVEDFLDEKAWTLDFIFNTHHHLDHIGGNINLKKRYHCPVYTSQYDRSRISTSDFGVEEGDVLNFGAQTLEVISTPGHTLGHIVYFLPRHQLLFCGDTVFVMGCGRLFEGDAQMMWESLEKILKLPASTRIFCAHEYTLANARFALRVGRLPDSFGPYLEVLQNKRMAFIPTVPTTLAEEKLYNPFLKAADSQWAAAIGLPEKPAAEVFATLRRRKDLDI